MTSPSGSHRGDRGVGSGNRLHRRRTPALRTAGLTAALFFLPPAGALAPLRAEEPFPVGEQLTYSVSWAYIKAGDTVMTVLDRETVRGRASFHLVSQARSAGFFASLFRLRIRDRADAWLDAVERCSLGIDKRIREGGRRRDQRIVFERRRSVALIDDTQIKDREVAIPPCTLDILTAMYWYRYQRLVPGGVLELPVHNDGKSYVLRVDVVRGERIRTRVGEFQTILLRPQAGSAPGLFQTGRDVQISVSDDDQRVPVRLRSRFAIGWVTAMLVKREIIDPGAFRDITVSW